MLFFKPKPKFDEILPPPPPSPSFEQEEPIFEAVKQKPKKSPELLEFSALVKELDKEIVKSQKGKPKLQKGLKKGKYGEAKASKAENRIDDALSDADFEVPEDLKGLMPEDHSKLAIPVEDELNIDGVGTSTNQKVLEDAREEIKGAIEKIKQRDSPSLIRRWLSRRQESEEQGEEKMAGLQENGVQAIRENIQKARDALANFDVEGARKIYLDIMRSYNSASEGDKAKVYNEIRELYFERQSAEKLKQV
ncbi:hypothetical protein HYS31_07605 [Candidatus Woesearchaeota archaeon]|nr:hypothetical protein [Candidatus Woesearchaeota archaeon]